MSTNIRYIKLQPIQYNDDSIVECENLSYRSFIERESGYELEASCKILNSRARIGGPLHLKLIVTNIGGIDIERFKIDINSYSSADNKTPYYDRYVLWIKEKLEVGQSIEKEIVLQNSYKELDLSNNDLSEIITESEKELRGIEYSIPTCDDPLNLKSCDNLQSKTKIIRAVNEESFPEKHDSTDDFVSKDAIFGESEQSLISEVDENKNDVAKDISFTDCDSIINNKNISVRTKRTMSTDQQYNTIISPIYDNFYCKDDTLIINKKKKMKSFLLTNDFDYLITTLPSVIHVEFKHANMKAIPCRQYQFKLCSEYFTGDLLVARPGINIPKDKTPRYTHYNVLMLGTCRNGKTSLINSFLTLFNNRITLMSPYLQKLYYENKDYLLFNIKELLPESLHVRFYDCPLESIKTFNSSQYSYNNLDLILSGNFPYDFPVNTTNVELLGKIHDDKSYRRHSYNFNNSTVSIVKSHNNETLGSNGSLKGRPLSYVPLQSSSTKHKSFYNLMSLRNSLQKIHVVILPISYNVIDSSEDFKLYTKLFKYVIQLNIPVVTALTNIDQLPKEKIDEYTMALNTTFKSSYVYPIYNYTISNNKLKSFEKDREILRLLCNSIYLAQQSIFHEFNEDSAKKTNFIKNKSCIDISINKKENYTPMITKLNDIEDNRDVNDRRRNSKFIFDELISTVGSGNESSNLIDMTRFSKEELSSIYEDSEYDTTIFDNITRIDKSGEEEIDVILSFDSSCINDQEMLKKVKQLGLSISSQYQCNINIGAFLYGEKMQNISGLTYDKKLFEYRLASMEQMSIRHSPDGDTLFRTLKHCKTLLDAQYHLSDRQQLWLFMSECSNDDYYQLQIKKLAETLRSNQYNAEIFCIYLRKSPVDESFNNFLKNFSDLVIIFDNIDSVYNYITPPITSTNDTLNPKLYLKFCKILKESTKVHLLRNQLTGFIPYNIGDLVKMTSLNLNVNLLSSYLPSSIGNLVNLTELQLSFNKLSGEIPISIGNLKNLKILKMSNNQFTGCIPYCIGNLINLEKLRLENNRLSGPIPDSIGNLVKLEKLQLDNNFLNGAIPTSIGNLVKLRILKLGNNKLRGTIPSTIGSLSNLSILYLNDNYLSGNLPDTMLALRKLAELYLENNENLGGEVSEEYNTVLSLKKINIYGTKLKNNTFI